MYRLHHSEFRAIGIDFDGTLVDSDKVHLEARLLAYEQLATELNEPSLARIDPVVHAEGHYHGSNPHDINTWIIEQAGIVVNGVDLATQIAERKKDNYLELVNKGLEPRPGAVEFVSAALSRWSENVAIVTTAHLDEITTFLDVQGLTSSFTKRQLVTHESVEHLKPHPEAYERAKRNLGLKAMDRLVAIEDSPRGIASAKAAGAATIALATPDYQQQLLELTGEAKPHRVAGGFNDLAAMLGL